MCHLLMFVGPFWNFACVYRFRNLAIFIQVLTSQVLLNRWLSNLSHEKYLGYFPLNPGCLIGILMSWLMPCHSFMFDSKIGGTYLKLATLQLILFRVILLMVQKPGVYRLRLVVYQSFSQYLHVFCTSELLPSTVSITNWQETNLFIYKQTLN